MIVVLQLHRRRLKSTAPRKRNDGFVNLFYKGNNGFVKNPILYTREINVDLKFKGNLKFEGFIIGFAQNIFDNRKGNDKMKKKFVSTMRKGFQITFENGLTASVQWGAGNYCDNHFPEDADFSCKRDAQSDTAEVAVIYKGDLMDDIYQFLPEDCSSDGTVAGWLSPEDVLYFLNKVREFNN